MAEINKQMNDIGIPPIVPWEDEIEKETQVRAEKEFFTEQPYEDTDVKPLSLKEKWKKAQEKKLELLYGPDKEGITGRKRIKELWKTPIDNILDITQISTYKPPLKDAPMWQKVLHYGAYEGAVGGPIKAFFSLPAGGIGYLGGLAERTLTSSQIYFPHKYKEIFGDSKPNDIAHKLEESLGIALLGYGTAARPSLPLSKTQKTQIKHSKQYKKAETEVAEFENTYSVGAKKVYTTPPKKGAGTYLGKNIDPILDKLKKKERPLEKERITAGKQTTLLEDIVVPKIEVAQKESKGFLRVLDVKLKEPWTLIKEQRVEYYPDLPRPKESRQYKTKGVGEIKVHTETGTLSGVKDYRRKVQTEGYEHGLQWLYESNYNFAPEHYSFLNRLKNLPEEPVVGNNFAVGYTTKGYEFRNIKLPSSKDTKPINLNVLKPHQLAEVPGRTLNPKALIEYLESLPKYGKDHPEVGRRMVVTKNQIGFDVMNPVTTLSIKHVPEILAKAEYQGLIVHVKHQQGGKWIDGGYYWTKKGIEYVNKPLKSRIKIGTRTKTEHKDVVLPHKIKSIVNKSVSELKAEGFTTYQKSIREVLTKDEWSALVKETAKEPDPYFASQDLLLLKLQYDAGLRGGELRNLKISDIKGKTISRIEYHGGQPRKVDILPTAGKAEGILEIRKEITKTEKDRTTTLNPETLYLIAKHIRLLEKKFPNTEYLFPNIKDSQNPISYRTHNTTINRLSKDTGIPIKVNTHTVRRTRATHMREEGIEYEIIREKMGHSSPLTTALYIKDSIENIRNLLHKYSGAETQILNLTPLEQIMTGVKQGKQDLPAPSVYIKGMESALNNLVKDGRISQRTADARLKKLKQDIKLGVVKPSQLTNLVPKEKALTVSKEYTAHTLKTQQSRVLYNLQQKIKPIIKGDNRPVFETTDPLNPNITYRLPLGTEWVDPVTKTTYKVIEGKAGKLSINTVYTKSQLKEFKKKQKRYTSFE
tara:strand:+ start:380 stop:3325 length:2946 start_codon:yes stop_codon:yes gene_type:complete